MTLVPLGPHLIWQRHSRFGLFVEPPEQCAIERNVTFQMVTNGLTFQRQSLIPDTPEGTQAIFIRAARADDHLIPAIIKEHKLYFNPHIISLMFI